MKITTTLPAAIPSQGTNRPAKPVSQPKQLERVLLAIDVSGSMGCAMPGSNSSRVDVAKDAVAEIVKKSSRAVTALGLAPFDHALTVVEPIGTNYTGILAQNAMLNSRGGTDYAQIFEAANEHHANRVILLSDGEPSDGEEAIKLAHKAKKLGVRFDTVGIGESGDLLRTIAEITGGVYTYAKDAAALVKTFAQLETRARLQLEQRR